MDFDHLTQFVRRISSVQDDDGGITGIAQKQNHGNIKISLSQHHSPSHFSPPPSTNEKPPKSFLRNKTKLNVTKKNRKQTIHAYVFRDIYV